MTEGELRDAEARYQRAVGRSEALRAERNRLVGEALREGWTHARIARVTGLSRGRISQFVGRDAEASAASGAGGAHRR